MTEQQSAAGDVATVTAGDAAVADGQTAPDPRRWLALLVIAVAQLMIVLDATIVNIALPSMQRDLGISDANRQWVVTAYTLAFGGLLLLGGRIADYTGRKRTFLIGLGGFAAASALGGFAGSAALLFAARGLQGAFAALMAPAALSLLTVTFSRPDERAKAFGVFGAISGGGAAIGLILGGVLTQYTSWRWCLGVNVPIALITMVAAAAIVRESKAPGQRRYDVPGALLVSLGLVSLVYGFTEAAKQKNPGRSTEVLGWTAGSTLFFLGAAVVLLVAFVVWEQRSQHPLLPLRIALDRNRGGCYLVFLLVGAGLFAMFLFLTYYFQLTLGYSPLRSGFALLPFSIGIIVSAGIVSQLLPRFGPKPLMVPGLALGVTGMLLLTRITAQTSYWSHVLPAVLMLSMGMAAVFIPASSTALAAVGPRDAGVASALLNTSQQVGGSLGTALLNTLYAGAVTTYVAGHLGNPADAPRIRALAFVHGYHVAFFWGAVLLACALLVALLLINIRRSDLQAGAGGGAATEGQVDHSPGRDADDHKADGRDADGRDADGRDADGRDAAAGGQAGPRNRDLPAPTVARDDQVTARLQVRGRVTGPAGAALPGASVTLTDLAGRQLARAHTDGRGSYRVVPPTDGAFLLVCAAELYQPYAAALDVGSEPVEHDIALTAATRLRGRVRRAGAGPVSEAFVTLLDARGQVASSVMTGADGEFVLDDLLAGDYTLTATADRHLPQSLPVSLPGSSTVTLDVDLVAGGSLAGVVRVAATGQPLPAAMVTVLDGDGTVVAHGRTDSAGGYAFGDLRPGGYTVTSSGYAPTAAHAHVAGGRVATMDLALGQHGEPAGADTAAARGSSSPGGGGAVRMDVPDVIGTAQRS